MADRKFTDLPAISAANNTQILPTIDAGVEKSVTIPQIKTQILSEALNLTSGQITFPATAVPSSNANTLDDYEEGTWTPAVGGTATYGTRTATYTKIGRLVQVSCEMTITTIGTGSQNTISGLPFTAGSVGTTIVQFASLGVSVVFLLGLVSAGGSTVGLQHLTGAATSISTGGLLLGNGSTVRFSLVYTV